MLITRFHIEKRIRVYYSIFCVCVCVFWLQCKHSCMSKITLNPTTLQHHHPFPLSRPYIKNNRYVICMELNMTEYSNQWQGSESSESISSRFVSNKYTCWSADTSYTTAVCRWLPIIVWDVVWVLLAYGKSRWLIIACQQTKNRRANTNNFYNSIESWAPNQPKDITTNSKWEGQNQIDHHMMLLGNGIWLSQVK